MSVGQIPALTVIGTIKMRRGESGARTELLDTLRLARDTREIQRIAPVALALTEHAWLSGDLDAASLSLAAAHCPADATPSPWDLGRMTAWATRLGQQAVVPPAAALAATRLRFLGERVPRGVRAATRGNPAGLTSREVEVLRLVSLV
jgi:hypothetical protein